VLKDVWFPGGSALWMGRKHPFIERIFCLRGWRSCVARRGCFSIEPAYIDGAVNKVTAICLVGCVSLAAHRGKSGRAGIATANHLARAVGWRRSLLIGRSKLNFSFRKLEFETKGESTAAITRYRGQRNTHSVRAGAAFVASDFELRLHMASPRPLNEDPGQALCRCWDTIKLCTQRVPRYSQCEGRLTTHRWPS